MWGIILANYIFNIKMKSAQERYRERMKDNQEFKAKRVANTKKWYEKCKENGTLKKSSYRSSVEQGRKNWMKYAYGITIEEYEKMALAQDNKCSICGKEEDVKHQSGKTKRLAVDHCHISGKVRSLLCTNCNTGLGKFLDSRELLVAALAYLDLHAISD